MGRRILPVSVWLFLLGLVPLLVSGRVARAGGDLESVEQEFRDAIGMVVPAAVTCVPLGAKEGKPGLGSSGVIVSRSGYVLSDGDAGALPGKKPGGPLQYASSVEVRVADLEAGGFKSYRATVVRRIHQTQGHEEDLDTSLLKIQDVPPGGFPFAIPPGRSDHLQVGDYTFVTGNAWDASRETPPATTAGVVAALTPLPPGDAGGSFECIYTSAAVNPGVNGGPVVDVEGHLIGTVSTFVLPRPNQPFQFLGKVMPIDRIRAAYQDLPDAKEIFGAVVSEAPRAKDAAALEAVYRRAGRRVYPNVVSLEVERSEPLSTESPGEGGIFKVPRYTGPVSGIVIDADGWIVTSLYNMTNVASLVFSGATLPRWPPPPAATVAAGLAAVKKVTVHYPDGHDAPARLVAHDDGLGVLLLKAEPAAAPTGTTTPPLAPLEAAPPQTFTEGRLVVAVGNPFGARRSPDPLLAVGIFSKFHAADTLAVWRGQWQTDVATTDANCGGAAVDLRGRLLGMLQIWSPPMFGRRSGVAFLVPWQRILDALPALKQGKSTNPGFLGVAWRRGQQEAVIGSVVPQSPAASAGIAAGDRIVEIDGVSTPTLLAVVQQLALRFAGETLRVRVDRGGKNLDFDVTLAERP